MSDIVRLITPEERLKDAADGMALEECPECFMRPKDVEELIEKLEKSDEMCRHLASAVELALGFSVSFREDYGFKALQFPEVGFLFAKMTKALQAYRDSQKSEAAASGARP